MTNLPASLVGLTMGRVLGVQFASPAWRSLLDVVARGKWKGVRWSEKMQFYNKPAIMDAVNDAVDAVG